MKSFLSGIAILSLSAQVLAAPTNAQLNGKIKRLTDRVEFLETVLASMKKSPTGYVFKGFTAEDIKPVLPEAYDACRTEYGPKASVANTQEVLEALRDEAFSLAVMATCTPVKPYIIWGWRATDICMKHYTGHLLS